MLFNSLVYLLFSNSVTLRRDLSILFNRIVIVSLQYSIILHILSLFMCNKGISLHGGLLHITNITQIFQIFIFVVCICILQLTSFFPRKVWISSCSSIKYLLFNNFIYYRTKIINKMGTLCSGIALLCLKLSNSRDALKLLVPNRRGNSTCRWINYSGMVISQKMIEREVGNHVSKSITYLCKWIKYLFILVIVKEQRVDGSCRIDLRRFRSTLAGFERNHPTGIPSKQIDRQIRLLSSIVVQQNKNQNHKINPYFIIGFADGEGSFVIRIRKNNNLKVGWNVEFSFQIGLHSKDKTLL